MAEDVTGHRRADHSGGEPGASPVPEPRPPGEPVARPERLPDVRPEFVEGALERPRRGGPPGPPSAYAPRFRALTGGLVGLGIGAVVAAGVALFAPGFQTGPSWSQWHPSKDGDAGAAQIASHVARNYRLPTGEQMVLVKGGPLKVADLDIPVRIVMAGAGQQSISVVPGRSVLFELCGLGARCSINKGTPSVERFLLLRREALELALYTFRYLDGVQNVVALLPPAPGEQPKNALFFRRDQLAPALDRPLAATLQAQAPTVNSVEEAPDSSEVRRFTDRNLFVYSFEQAQDLGALLVLNRRTAQ